MASTSQDRPQSTQSSSIDEDDYDRITTPTPTECSLSFSNIDESEIVEQNMETDPFKMQEMQDYIKKLKQIIVEQEGKESKDSKKWRLLAKDLQRTIDKQDDRIFRQHQEILNLKKELEQSLHMEEYYHPLGITGADLKNENRELKGEIEKLNGLIAKEREQSVIMHQSTIRDFEARLRNEEGAEDLKLELFQMGKQFDFNDLKKKLKKQQRQISKLEKQLEEANLEMVITGHDPHLFPNEQRKEPKKSEQESKKYAELREKFDAKAEELELANQQIVMIIDHNEVQKAQDASEYAQEHFKQQKEIEELNKTICFLKQQLSL